MSRTKKARRGMTQLEQPPFAAKAMAAVIRVGDGRGFVIAHKRHYIDDDHYVCYQERYNQALGEQAYAFDALLESVKPLKIAAPGKELWSKVGDGMKG